MTTTDTTRGRVIALHGYPRAGKDTIATHMVEKHGYTRLAFATALKVAVSGMFGSSPEELEPVKDVELESYAIFHCLDPEYRRFCIDAGHNLYTPRTPRFHLKTHGTDYMQTRDPLRWVRETLSALSASSGPVVITDLRSYEDFREVKALRSFCALAERPLSVWEVRVPGLKAPDSHPSNWLLLDHFIDSIVVNHNGMLPNTLTYVDLLLARLESASTL